MNRSIIFILLITFAISHKGNSQLKSEEVNALVETTLEKFGSAGMAVGIVKDGTVIHSKGYGIKSKNSNDYVNEHTQFAIASNSKAFTTTALAILVEQGKIDWDDKVIEHIPEFKMYNSYVTENFTIQDLLTHRSGLGLGAGDLMFIPEGSDFTIQDILSNFQYFEPQSAFRTKYDYDNILYIVAGELIARVSGQSWEDFVQNNIFKTLGMQNTFSSFSSIKSTNKLATPFLIKNGNLEPISHFEQTANGAAGGIISTVADMCQWMLVHLNHGKYGSNNENELFTLDTQREMWRIHNSHVSYPSKPYNSHFSGYGLGWELTDVQGKMAAYHSGLLPGMASMTILVPDLDLGIVVLINTSDEVGNSPVEPIGLTILDKYLKIPDNDWINKVHKRLQSSTSMADSVVSTVWKTVEKANDDHIMPDNYVGVYEDNWFGQVEVSKRNDQLWFQSSRSPKLNGRLQYYKASSFAIKWEYQKLNADAFVIFTLDEEGKAEGIKLKGISPEMDFSFDFQDLNLKRVE